jgi:hypothetical protein
MPVRARQSTVCTVGVRRKEPIVQAENTQPQQQQSMGMFKRVFSSCMDARKYSVK